MFVAEDFRIEPVARMPAREPLKWLLGEHERHRQFCRLAAEISRSDVCDPQHLSTLIDFIRGDMALHIRDEEEALFPLLRGRAWAEDELDECLGRLIAEHEADDVRAQAVLERLEICRARQTPRLDDTTRRALSAFAAHELQHLALENAVILPIARLRLTRDELEALAQRLAARRGILLEAESA